MADAASRAEVKEHKGPLGKALGRFAGMSGRRGFRKGPEVSRHETIEAQFESTGMQWDSALPENADVQSHAHDDKTVGRNGGSDSMAAGAGENVCVNTLSWLDDAAKNDDGENQYEINDAGMEKVHNDMHLGSEDVVVQHGLQQLCRMMLRGNTKLIQRLLRDHGPALTADISRQLEIINIDVVRFACAATIIMADCQQHDFKPHIRMLLPSLLSAVAKKDTPMECACAQVAHDTMGLLLANRNAISSVQALDILMDTVEQIKWAPETLAKVTTYLRLACKQFADAVLRVHLPRLLLCLHSLLVNEEVDVRIAARISVATLSDRYPMQCAGFIKGIGTGSGPGRELMAYLSDDVRNVIQSLSPSLESYEDSDPIDPMISSSGSSMSSEIEELSGNSLSSNASFDSDRSSIVSKRHERRNLVSRTTSWIEVDLDDRPSSSPLPPVATECTSGTGQGHRQHHTSDPATGTAQGVVAQDDRILLPSPPSTARSPHTDVDLSSIPSNYTAASTQHSDGCPSQTASVQCEQHLAVPVGPAAMGDTSPVPSPLVSVPDDAFRSPSGDRPSYSAPVYPQLNPEPASSRTKDTAGAILIPPNLSTDGQGAKGALSSMLHLGTTGGMVDIDPHGQDNEPLPQHALGQRPFVTPAPTGVTAPLSLRDKSNVTKLHQQQQQQHEQLGTGMMNRGDRTDGTNGFQLGLLTPRSENRMLKSQLESQGRTIEKLEKVLQAQTEVFGTSRGQLETLVKRQMHKIETQHQVIRSQLLSAGSLQYATDTCEVFVWLIEDIMAKRHDEKHPVFSPEFTSAISNHSFRLKVWPDGSSPSHRGNLGCGLQIRKGNGDKRARWPFNIPYTLTVLDKQGKARHNETVIPGAESRKVVQQSFQKPASCLSVCQGSNRPWGFSELMPWVASDLSDLLVGGALQLQVCFHHEAEGRATPATREDNQQDDIVHQAHAVTVGTDTWEHLDLLDVDEKDEDLFGFNVLTARHAPPVRLPPPPSETLVWNMQLMLADGFNATSPVLHSRLFHYTFMVGMKVVVDETQRACVSFELRIRQGRDDDIAEWPLRQRLTLTLYDATRPTGVASQTVDTAMLLARSPSYTQVLDRPRDDGGIIPGFESLWVATPRETAQLSTPKAFTVRIGIDSCRV